MAIRRTSFTPFILGSLAGAGLMFLLDPRNGRRRRVYIVDKTRHYGTRGGHFAGQIGRDLVHRAQGLVAETRARLRNESVTDAVVESRVRAQLGRIVQHPHAVVVAVTNGEVRLSGDIAEVERPRLLRRIERIRGVRKVA